MSVRAELATLHRRTRRQDRTRCIPPLANDPSVVLKRLRLGYDSRARGSPGGRGCPLERLDGPGQPTTVGTTLLRDKSSPRSGSCRRAEPSNPALQVIDQVEGRRTERVARPVPAAQHPSSHRRKNAPMSAASIPPSRLASASGRPDSHASKKANRSWPSVPPSSLKSPREVTLATTGSKTVGRHDFVIAVARVHP